MPDVDGAHTSDITVVTRQASHRERERKRETEQREKKRELDCRRNEGRHTWGPKERRKACRSVPSQWHHSGDATRNREREERERSRERFRGYKKQRKRGEVLVSMRGA